MRIGSLKAFSQLEEYFDEDAIEDDDVDTIGGLVVKNLGRIAKPDDVTRINDMVCRVKEVEGARITKLIIKKDPVEEKQEVQKTQNVDQ